MTAKRCAKWGRPVRAAGFVLSWALAFAPAIAHAGDFDEAGHYVAAKDAVFFEDFDAPTRYVPDSLDMACLPDQYAVAEEADALSGTSVAQLQVTPNCAERFLATLPVGQSSYRATVWIRHGSVDARLIVLYPPETNRHQLSARFAPTGRATSDGWVELATNDVPIDTTGDAPPKVYLFLVDFADAAGIDVDAFEMSPHGDYVGELACSGARDPVCADGICLGGRCRVGGLSVPPLPEGQLRDDMVDTMEGQLETFFGGKLTRERYLPTALETLERARDAETAWQFWNGWATAIHQLHDWHTDSFGPIGEDPSSLRLNACFIEGDADLSHAIVPKDSQFKDILVSHVGPDSGGLRTGDRLVAVDGMHPIAWARSLTDVNWSYHVASDPDSFADSAEELGGPLWQGASILRFAKTITVLRCDATTCDGPPETIAVSSLTGGSGGQDVACDNRPFYHLGANGPDPTNHYVFGRFFQGPVDGTTPQEAIYGMVWDTLYGGGDPSSKVNTTIKDAVTFWKANARGVILDHRAGNGGTLDAATYMTEIGRPEEVIAVTRMPIESAGYTGPADATEGLTLFHADEGTSPYRVGSPAYDPALPVALILHRDGSASDYMPYGMKGSPKVKLFGPGPTAGAFSTYIEFSYWGNIGYQFASGDTLSKDGVSLMGHAVWPDVVVQQKQSDLLAGIDSLHEAALAWVRSELK